MACSVSSGDLRLVLAGQLFDALDARERAVAVEDDALEGGRVVVGVHG
jgi:hypothetical protein